MTTSNLSYAYVRRDGRLALFTRSGADLKFWDDTWARNSDEQLRSALRRTQSLGTHHFFFKRWLPHDGVILEAGCGIGVWVNRLRENG